MAEKPSVLIVHPRTVIVGGALVLGSLAMASHAMSVPAEPVPERAAVLPKLDPKMRGLPSDDEPANRRARRKQAKLDGVR